jgi:hypothetical protein
LAAPKINKLLVFSVLFCWFFSVMVAYTSLNSGSTVEIVLKGIIGGLGVWCGIGLLKRNGQVLWFAVALCLYAICGSLLWLYDTVFMPLYHGLPVTYGHYEILAALYIVCGSIVIWFLLHERTRHFLKT